MTTIDLVKAREEIMIFLRNSDILSTTQRGVTTKTDTFTATAGQTVFTLSSYTVRNIRTVTVQSVAKKAYFDYTPSYNTGSASSIVFLTGLTLNDAVSITYDYSSGTAEKVWPDYPQLMYLPTDCPRLGFDFISMRTKPIGIGTTGWLTDALVRVKAYDIGTYRTIDAFFTTLRSALMTSQKAFYHFQVAHPPEMSGIIIHPELSKTVFERSMDIELRFGFES